MKKEVIEKNHEIANRVKGKGDTWEVYGVDKTQTSLTDALEAYYNVATIKPKAIIAVHLYGVPYHIEKVREIADKYTIQILEDSAEAFGSTYKGQKCGTFGDIGILSFNGNKIITTSGGGAIVTRTKEQKEKEKLFSASKNK